MIRRNIENRRISKQPNFTRHTTHKFIVQHYNLVQRVAHFPNAARNAPREIVVGNHDHRRRRVAEILRNVGGESVVVEENGIEFLGEKRGRQFAFEIIVSDVEKFQIWNPHNDFRERAHKSVVANVELVKQNQSLEARGDNAAESVGVDVKQGDVSQQTELHGQVTGDVGMVEVNSGDDFEFGVVESRGAENSGVGTDIGADPIGCGVERVGINGLLPGLKGDESPSEPGIGKGFSDHNFGLVIVRQIIILVKG